MTRMDWERARQRESNRRDRRARQQQGAHRPLGRPVWPPTDRQTALLRQLTTELGERYIPARTSQQASARITHLLALKRRQKPKQ